MSLTFLPLHLLQSKMTTSSAPRDLLDFLTEAELQQYFQAFNTELKVSSEILGSS